MLGIRTTPRDDLKYSPAECCTGNGDSTDPIYIPFSLQECTHVFVRVDRVKRALEAPYEGPYEVVRKLRKYFVVRRGDKEISISIDRLKPAFLTPKSEKPDETRTVSKRLKKKTVTFHPTTKD